MNLPNAGWSNKSGTSDRSCKCGTWSKHWENYSGKSWPSTCSVQGCNNKATVGGHVINASVSGERIVPLCDSCNKLGGSFGLKGSITLPSANRAETCDKKP